MSTNSPARWALVENGAIRELTFRDPDGHFPPAMPWMPGAPADAEPGWAYADGVFAAPPPPPPAPVQTVLGARVFAARFTAAETNAIHAAALGNAGLLGWLLTAASGPVDLGDARTAAGLQALVGAGLLTAPRAAEILVP